MTPKRHISKTLRFLYGQVAINVKSDGRAIDRHAERVVTMLVEDLQAGCHRKGTKRKFIGEGGGIVQASSAWYYLLLTKDEYK